MEPFGRSYSCFDDAWRSLVQPWQARPSITRRGFTKPMKGLRKRNQRQKAKSLRRGCGTGRKRKKGPRANCVSRHPRPGRRGYAC